MQTAFNQSIWGDEGFSAILSMKPVPDIIRIISRDTSPPLWNIVEHFAFQIFGTQETVIRSLSLLFFLGAVFFTYKIGSHLYNWKTGLLALLLTLFNPFFFTYAFEGRMYSIMAFGVAASMYFFLKRMWKMYVISTLWALYSHHFAFFAVFVQGVWFLYEFFFGEKAVAKKTFKAFLVVGLGYLPWLIPLYNQVRMVGGGFWLGTPDKKDLINLIFDYLARGTNFPLRLPLLEIKLVDVALLLTIIILIIRNWLTNYKKTLFLLSWFLVPILLTYIISQKFQSIFFNRYLLYTIPPAMLLLASNKRGVSSWILLTLTLAVFAFIDYNYFVNPTKLPFREFAADVKNQEYDILINWNSKSHHLWESKYYGIPAPIYVPEGKGGLPYFVGTALMGEGDIIRQIPNGAKKVGVITSGPVEEVALSGYTEKSIREFGALKLIVLEKRYE